MKNGNILAVAPNKMRNNPRTLGDDPSLRGYLTHHAEALALSRVANPRGATIYVGRILSDGTPALSKPCSACEKLIKSLGVKKVVHT